MLVVLMVLNCINTKILLKFDGSCLKQEKVTFNYKNAVNIYFFYEINLWPFKQSADFTLVNFSLRLLSYLNTLTLIKINILDLMDTELFHYLTVVGLVKTQ